MYNIIYLDKVTSRDIPKLSPPIKAMVKSAIEEKLLADPIKFGKPLRYNLKNSRSLRIGDYRVIYQIENITIQILKIGHRRDCYDYERS
ncbi:MAG TPA: type II toxin-antitoxin system RelE/ParE family toxin [Rickettsia endosymbiont of Ceroptres masudai]|nr:type II toxin-antitoxin system RelE/ParE family toxin [Rickettsia endosymbiont of Ceroptres masudai]